MGESKGGEGRARRDRADRVAAALADAVAKDGRKLGQVKVERVTEGLWAVQVWEHGQQDPEAYFLDTSGWHRDE